MKPEDINEIIDGFLKGRDNDSQAEKVEVIFNSYSQVDWENWLTDIIYHGIGYPISSLSPMGDVILDIPDYLRANMISTSNYELAISSFISKTYFENPENIVLLERLLNTYIALSGYSANDTLIQILTLPTYTLKKGKYNFIKTLTLLALSKSSKLNIEKQEVDFKKEIINYIVLRGINEMRHDPYFYSTALRFSYIQISSKFFFIFLSLLLSRVELFQDENFKENIKHLLISKIEELFSEKLPSFHSDLLDWLLTLSNPTVKSFGFESNNLASQLVTGIALQMKAEKLGIDELSENELTFDTYKPIYSVLFVLSLLTDQDISPTKIFEDPEIICYVINNIVNDVTENEIILQYLFKSHIDFVLNTKIRILPELKKVFRINIDVDKLSQMLFSKRKPFIISKASIINELNLQRA